MIEDEKMQVAVFRFGVISDFVTGAQMSRAEKRRLMRDKCARKWQIPVLRENQAQHRARSAGGVVFIKTATVI